MILQRHGAAGQKSVMSHVPYKGSGCVILVDPHAQQTHSLSIAYDFADPIVILSTDAQHHIC